jgi:hypothetical protein
VNEVLAILVLLPFNYLAPWAIVRLDMRWLPPERLARCWNSASLGSAILAFGPLCLPFHFVKARGFLLGSLLGVASMWLVFRGLALVLTLLEALGNAN